MHTRSIIGRRAVTTMENGTRKLSTLELLRRGEKVKCKECRSGQYIPINDVDFSEADGFVCNKCGSTVNINKQVGDAFYEYCEKG